MKKEKERKRETKKKKKDVASMLAGKSNKRFYDLFIDLTKGTGKHG
jgi:hypothetical protein